MPQAKPPTPPGPPCGRKTSWTPHHTCRRTAGHVGLHRDAVRLQHATKAWGDNECAPESRRG